MVPNLGFQCDNVLVVNSDNFDNFWGDNHKVVNVTTFLTTFRQPLVLCERKRALKARARLVAKILKRAHYFHENKDLWTIHILCELPLTCRHCTFRAAK